MLGALRQHGKALGRYLAVALLALQVFAQLGHYREHRPSATIHHTLHHAATAHTDFATQETPHSCALCVLASSSATVPSAHFLPVRTLLTPLKTPALPERASFVSRSLRRAPPRAPPFS